MARPIGLNYSYNKAPKSAAIMRRNLTRHQSKKSEPRSNTPKAASNTLNEQETDYVYHHESRDKFINFIIFIYSIAFKTKESLSIFCDGVRDGLHIIRLKNYIFGSKVIFKRIITSVLINMILFAGFLKLLQNFIFPYISTIRFLGFSEFFKKQRFFETNFFFEYLSENTCWFIFRYIITYPLYILLTIINQIWYTALSKDIITLLKRDHINTYPFETPINTDYFINSSNNRTLSTELNSRRQNPAFAETVFRFLLPYLWLIHIQAFSFIPVIGKPLFVLQYAWLYSFYTIEYHWHFNNQPFCLNDVLFHFEKHSVYYLGFGLPYALLTSYFTPIYDWAASGVIFCFIIIVSAQNHPVPNPNFWPNLRFFELFEWELNRLLPYILALCEKFYSRFNL